MKLKKYSSFEEMKQDLKFGDLIIRGDDVDGADEFRYVEIVIKIDDYESELDYFHDLHKLKTLLVGGYGFDNFHHMLNKINVFYPYKEDFYFIRKVI